MVVLLGKILEIIGRKIFSTKWKQMHYEIVNYLINRIFEISNYEHGEDEEIRVHNLYITVMDILYNLGYCDDLSKAGQYMLVHSLVLKKVDEENRNYLEREIE